MQNPTYTVRAQELARSSKDEDGSHMLAKHILAQYNSSKTIDPANEVLRFNTRWLYSPTECSFQMSDFFTRRTKSPANVTSIFLKPFVY